MKNFLIPTLLFTLILLSVFLGHIYFKNEEYNQNANLYYFFYAYHYVFTIIILSGIVVFQNRIKDYMGLIVMVSSFVKIGLFLLIYKNYTIDLNRNLFLDFFIPYVSCLFFEIIFITKRLRQINY